MNIKLTECPCCKKHSEIREYRRLTQYYDEETNWIICCEDCKIADDDHWKGMWEEYYRGCL